MSNHGAWRYTDPITSELAALSINTATLRWAILRVLIASPCPVNGWELSYILDMPTITVVPRLCGLRDNGYIVQQGTRPGPTVRAQIAYVITGLGRQVAQ